MRTPLELATKLVEFLRPGCTRIEIAGSLRRGKTNPKDIEIVAIAKIVVGQQTDLFGKIYEVSDNLLDFNLEKLYQDGTGIWTLDPVLKRNGAKYKRLRYWGTPEICCDLFITTPEKWGVIFTIRTGSANFSEMIVTRARRMGMQVEDGRLWQVHRDDTKTVLETPEEIDFFRALEVDYLVPNLRVA